MTAAAPTAGTDASPALQQATLRTVTLRLMPALFCLYIISFLDRVNLGFAALQMNRDLGFSSAVYGFGSGIFFIGYSLCEVPSNLILARLGARRWIARIMVTWGVLASAMMFVQGPVSFYVLRFLLGVAEAGFFPGIIYYLGLWYPLGHRCRAVARFMAAIPVSGVVSGLLAGPLLALGGKAGLAGWQWLFLLEGLPAVLAGFLVLRYLPDGPEEVRWLPADGKHWLIARLKVECDDCHKRHSFGLRQALTNPVVWQLALIYFLCSNTAYAFGFFSPQLIKAALGGSNLVTGLVSAAISLMAAFVMVRYAAYAQRLGDPCRRIVPPAIIGGLGWLALTWVTGPAASLAALAIIPLMYAGNGPFWTLPSTFLTGRNAAGSIAFINTIGALGGFVGPNLLGLSKQWSGDYLLGEAALGMMALVSVAIALRLRSSRELATAASAVPVAV